MNAKQEEMNKTAMESMFNDQYGEVEKMTFALELAIQEVTKVKQSKH